MLFMVRLWSRGIKRFRWGQLVSMGFNWDKEGSNGVRLGQVRSIWRMGESERLGKRLDKRLGERLGKSLGEMIGWRLVDMMVGWLRKRLLRG